MSHLLEDLQSFLRNSPTSWHAVQEMGDRLSILDFTPLSENERWELEPGKSYFVARGGSFCVFSLPKKKLKKMVLLAAHTDSPCLKIKPNPQILRENMIQFGVEVYGGPILASWVGRDLGIAGKIVTSTQEKEIREHLVFIDDAPLSIPFLPIHLDREVNEKGLILNKQEHLLPVATLKNEPFQQSYLEMLLRRHLSFHALLSFDLFLVPLEESRFLGGEGEMLSSYRLDNLASVHAALVAVGKGKKDSTEILQMGVFWDHEEIGSETESGADSSFLHQILDRISHLLKLNVEDQNILYSRSLCVSIDVAHALNPNYLAKYDPNNSPLLGKGIAIKTNGELRYATNAKGAAQIIHLCQKHQLPYQFFNNRSDIKSGMTVGPFIAKKLGITTVDIGCPELSMHATREIISCRDYLDMVDLLTHLLNGES
ncbi:MAG: M18 family aminopeptidase [Chlamydiae bacterium]|nr:M18 family aminopeptidase [Chlamydiota bacterium]